MVSLTKEEREYCIQLLSHPAIHKLFDELEAVRLNEALGYKPTETDKINGALAECRAIKSLRQTLGIMGFEKKQAAG